MRPVRFPRAPIVRPSVRAGACVLALAASLLPLVAPAATVLVNRPDSFDAPGQGGCTLVRAIKLINAGTDIYAENKECTFSGVLGAEDTIGFALGFDNEFGAPTVVVTSDGEGTFNLPAIEKPVVIDGGMGPIKVAVIAGSGASGAAFEVISSHVVLRNLALGGFGPTMIDIGDPSTQVDDVRVEGCLVGLDGFGNQARPGSGAGIRVRGAVNVTLGGFGPDKRNVISGNAGPGIVVTGSNTFGIQILGNYIGVGADGALPMGNCASTGACGGIVVYDGAMDVNIGGPDANFRNVISSNHFDGVRIEGTGAPGGDPKMIRVMGNYIGVAADGVSARGNRGGDFDAACGVRIAAFASASMYDVGGPVAGAGNTIAHNQYCGVIAQYTSPLVQIGGNAIRDNDVIGIDLSAAMPADGRTANDSAGHLSGPSYFQNFPVLGKALETGDGDTFSVEGTILSPNTPFGGLRIEFFTSASGAQGAHYAGSVLSILDEDGLGSFSGSGLTLAPGDSIVTATASSVNGTSEFSDAIVLTRNRVYTDGFE